MSVLYTEGRGVGTGRADAAYRSRSGVWVEAAADKRFGAHWSQKVQLCWQQFLLVFLRTYVNYSAQKQAWRRTAGPVPHRPAAYEEFFSWCSRHHCLTDQWRRQDFVTGGSEVWVYRGSRLRSPPVPVVLSVYQRGSLLDGLAMYLSCDTKKFHDNESTHILHNFWMSTHRGGSFPPFPLAAPLL